MTRIVPLAFVTGAALFVGPLSVIAADMQQTDVYAAEEVKPARKYFWSGDWYLKVGAAGLVV